MSASVPATNNPASSPDSAEPDSIDLLSLFEKSPVASENPADKKNEDAVPKVTLTPNKQPNGVVEAPQKPETSLGSGKKIWAGIALVAGLTLSAVIYLSRSPDIAAGESKEAALWSATKAYPTAQAFRDYLTAFPDGSHHSEAEARLKSLETPIPSPTVETKTQAVNTAQNAAPSPGSQLPVTQQPQHSAQTEQDRPNQPDSRPPTTPTSPMPPSSVSAAATVPAEPVVRGKVILRVTPWGRIYVNRAGIGMTPPRMELDLPVGTHRVSVTNPAAPPMVWNIQVKKDEPVVLTHHFEPKTAGEQPAPPSSETD